MFHYSTEQIGGASETRRRIANIVCREYQPPIGTGILFYHGFNRSEILPALLDKEGFQKIEVRNARVESLSASPSCRVVPCNTNFRFRPGTAYWEEKLFIPVPGRSREAIF